MAWLDGAPGDPRAWFHHDVDAYRVDERVQIDWSRDWADGQPSPGIKQLSFVHRVPALTRDEFATHWSDRHTPLARVHHPGIWRYVQNIVIEALTPDAPGIDGVAELHFRTLDDLHHRYYDSEAGQRVIRDDVRRFIDRDGGGWRLFARETWLVG